MPATWLVFSVETTRRIVVPLPFILIWPFILAAGAAAGLIAALRRRRKGVVLAGTFCRCLFHLRGLEMDIHPRSGHHIRLRFL